MKSHGPINIIPFRIHNRPAFLQQDHPVIDPANPEYKRYWIDVTKKQLYGVWGHNYDQELKEGGGYRWCPGALWFYINLTPIEKEGEDNSAELDKPSLRDIDWLKGYDIAACDGFSGFEGDEEYTCFRPVEKLETGEHLKHAERKKLESEKKYICKPDGSYKKYVNALDYMYRNFDKPMGKPLWRNEAQNYVELTTRGLGKSYTMANEELAYKYVNNGCRTFEDLIAQKKSVTMTVGAVLSKYSDDLLNKFSVTYDYLRTHNGYYNDGITETPGWFWQPFEGQLGLEGKPFTNRTQIPGSKGFQGAGSKIYHVSYYKKDNAGIGKRGSFFTDEAGTLENFKKVHGFNSAAQKRESKFAKSVYSGTGGNMTQIEGIRDAFDNPAGYSALPIPDLFGYNNAFTGRFIPSYYRQDIYRNKNGEINLKEAYEDDMYERKKMEKESVEAYDEHIISYPHFPQEMFMQAAKNLFPTQEFEDRLEELEAGEWEKIAKVGTLKWVDPKMRNEVKFEIDITGKLRPFNRYNSENKSRDKSGVPVIYELPMEDKPYPTYNNPLYIVCYDPVAKEGDGSSSCAVIVFKFFYPKDMSKIQFNVVAEWYGRHKTLDENHDMFWRFCVLYGAKGLPELNNADVLRHGRDNRMWAWFQPEPKGALGEFNQTKSYEVGYYVTPGMKPTLAMYLNEVFNTVVRVKTEIGESGDPVQRKIIMASDCPSIRICDEALKYGPGNFDAISCMFGVSLIHRDKVLGAEGRTQPMSEEDIRSYERFVKKNRKPKSNTPHPAYTK